jgi:hypothetical protein
MAGIFSNNTNKFKKMRTKINIEAYYMTIQNCEDGFNLIICGNTNKGNGKDHEITFHFHNRIINSFIEKFKELLDHKAQLIANIRKLINL